jgi:integrase
MGKKIDRLTAKSVEKIKEPGYHPDGDGLYLQVSASLTKSWVFIYTLNGRTPEMGLGAYPVVSLVKAREKRNAGRGLLADGMDPIEHRDALRAQQALQKANTLSFEQCATKMIDSHMAGWKNPKHIQQWKNTLTTYAGPVIGKKPVQEVDTQHIREVLEPIWTSKPETASRVRGRIEQVLDWAKVRNYRTGENPARWRGHLDKLLPRKSKVHTVKHQPALPYVKINLFIEALRQQPGIAARAVEFAVLTAMRSGEVRGAKSAEFDLDEAVWAVPAVRMKMKRPHRVPLTPRAVEIVRDRLKANPDAEYVFPNSRNGKPLSDMALTTVLRRMNVKGEEAVVHGFRSTFRDWVAEQTNHQRELAEFALAHKLPSEVEGAYLRSDMFEKRRKLMRDWQRYIDRPQVAGKVLPMRHVAQRPRVAA